MKNKFLRIILLSALLLPFVSCEKDDGGGSSTTNTFPLPRYSTLYSYIGRTDLETISQQFRNKSYEVGIENGIMIATAPNNFGNDETLTYILYFNDENTINQCDVFLATPKDSDRFISVFNDQTNFCKDWILSEFHAYIYGQSHYTNPDSFRAALDALDGPTDKIEYYAKYENGFVCSIEYNCEDDDYLVYSIENTHGTSNYASLQVAFGGVMVPMGWYNFTSDGQYFQVEASAAHQTLPQVSFWFNQGEIIDAFYSEHQNRIVDNLAEWVYDEDLPHSFHINGFDATTLTIESLYASMTMYDYYADNNYESFVDEKELTITATNITFSPSKKHAPISKYH